MSTQTTPAPKVVSAMSNTGEQTDYPSLRMGYPHVSMQTVELVDLDVHVYGLDEIKGSKLPISVIIASHGRCNSAKKMVPFAEGLLGEISDIASKSSSKRTHDVLVVTLDHRNHGTRTKHKNKNLDYRWNPMHLADMAATIYGGVQDHAMTAAFLATFLFPHGERVIDSWMATGFSLGGNTVWRLLREDPLFKVAVPICGLPADTLFTYLGDRAVNMGLQLEPPTVPPSLHSYLTARPTLNEAAYAGKKILTIHGGNDTLVAYKHGEQDIEDVKNVLPAGDLEIWVQENVGHVCTPEMLKKAAGWFWRWGLSEEEQKAAL